jgi:hypothetical protein
MMTAMCRGTNDVAGMAFVELPNNAITAPVLDDAQI